MKKRFTEEQILQVLGEVRAGAKVGETCRKHGSLRSLTTSGETSLGACRSRKQEG